MNEVATLIPKLIVEKCNIFLSTFCLQSPISHLRTQLFLFKISVYYLHNCLKSCVQAFLFNCSTVKLKGTEVLLIQYSQRMYYFYVYLKEIGKIIIMGMQLTM